MSIRERRVAHDVIIIALSIAAAVALIKTGVLVKLIATTQAVTFLGSFIAGMLFTSVFTTAPAIVALGEIATAGDLLTTAAIGALGAVVGDLLIFKFVRDKFSVHILSVMAHQGWIKRLRVLLKLKLFRWISFIIGGLIIASPLPDELGISVLGFSKLKIRSFILISFTFNFIGILLIGAVARAL